MYDTRADGNAAQFHGNPLLAGDLLVTGSDGQGGGYAYAFERTTGELRWKTQTGDWSTDLVRFGGLVIGGTDAGDLSALEIASGKAAWTWSPAARPYGRAHSRSPALLGDRLFFAGPDGKVYAFDAASGKVLWEHDLGCNVTSALLATDAGVYAGGADRHLYRLAPATGAVTARIELEAAPYFRLLAAGGAILALVGQTGFVAIDPDLKAVRWKRTAPREWTTPRPLVDGETVLVGGSGELNAFRVDDGAVAWSSKLDGMPRGLGLAAGVLYLGTLRGQLLAYELGGGSERFVHIHRGIQGGGDLNAADHDWRNPVAQIVVRRIP
jgi:outer membrane protein assembly factor BamB